MRAKRKEHQKDRIKVGVQQQPVQGKTIQESMRGLLGRETEP